MDPLSARARAFLDRARRGETTTAEERERLWRTVSAAIAASSIDVTRPSDGGGGGATTGDVAGDAPCTIDASPTLLSRIVGALKNATVPTRWAIPAGAALFAAGVTAGRATTPPPFVVAASPGVPSAEQTPSPTGSPSPRAEDVPIDAGGSTILDEPAHSAQPNAPAPPPLPLRSVRAPLDAEAAADEARAIFYARALLARGRSSDALGVLERLEREHPHGTLGEERDALRVLALCALGQKDEGSREAERFLRARPISAYAERVRAACTSSNGRPR